MRTAQVQEVLSDIDGQLIVDDLLELAAIGGEELPPTEDHPVHLAANRLALTEADKLAQETFIRPRMEAAGMDVLTHPLALIGTLPGRDPELAPVVIMSHTDTVPRADIYDGNLGVLGGLYTARSLHERGLQMERDIMVVSLSGEESARFNIALFGSRALFHGLRDEELDSRRGDDQSIREALGERGVSWASQPVFGPNGTDLPKPHTVIELHVEQGTKLVESGTDLGVVHAIAAPERYRSLVGYEPIEQDHRTYPHARYFKLHIDGKADHSGATPMGKEHRADGLLEAAQFLGPLLEAEEGHPVLAISEIEVKEGAMNKVPGLTTATLRLAADSEGAVEASYQRLQEALAKRRAHHETSGGRFPANPLHLEAIDSSEAGVFFEPQQMAARQMAAFQYIDLINLAATERASDNVVGTVGTFATSEEGIISLGVDIRGIELGSRNRTVERILHAMGSPLLHEVQMGFSLPGSGSPVELDPSLVAQGAGVIKEFDIGSAVRMFSAAGHDTQNAARAEVPSVMLFCQSEGGIAHNPDAFTSPANLEKGVQALAALTLRLADQPYRI